jgi:uncharacterized protein (DUF885 family)
MNVRNATAALLCLALGACAKPPGPPPGESSGASGAPAADATLGRLVEDYFEEYLAQNPVAATFIGDHRYDDRLPPGGPAERAAAQALEQRFHERLETVGRAALSPAGLLNYEVFDYGRRLALEGFAFPAHLLPLDQLNNAATFFAQMGSGTTVQPFATAEDYERFARRMEQFPAWADQAIAWMREGAAKGVVQPRIVMERVLPQLAAQIVATPEASVFWQPVANMPPAIAGAERERLAARYRGLIGERVIPAYRRLHQFVRDEYLPKCRASVGLAALPDGERWYAFLARAYTTTEAPVEEIHQLGLAEIARLEAEIAKVAGRVGYRGSVAALAESMRRDPRFAFAKPGDLVAAYADLRERVTANVPRLFALMPKAALEVRPMEDFRAASAPAAEYWAPSADGSRPGVFYVNTYDLPARPSYEVETIFLHEAIPGHHFQIALAIEDPALPRFRRYGSDDAFSAAPDFSTAYVEGWALYAESLGDELGLYTDPYRKLGNLFAESWRAARLVVDTGLHAKGWSREQAIDYLLTHTASSRTDAAAEVERYIVWPGQALAYKTGELTIRRLRARAERELGARFDVRAFHAAILADGALPMTVLEAKIGRWIEAQR